MSFLRPVLLKSGEGERLRLLINAGNETCQNLNFPRSQEVSGEFFKPKIADKLEVKNENCSNK